MSHKMNLQDPSGLKRTPKKGNKSYSNDPRHRENIIRQLFDAFQDHFDLSLIASVAHTCQWDIQKAREVLRLLSGKKESKKKKSDKSKNGIKDKPKSLPGTLRSDKDKILGKSLESATSAHHSSTHSLPSGQVWQRHYKSKPQSPGLLTMIPPNSKEVIKVKPSKTSRPLPKHVDPDIKKASATVKRIQQLVQNGSKVMILMRGVPGSGKTHLAHVVVSLMAKGDLSQHILSTDDYFILLGRGNYAYDYNQLPQAHNWNQKRVSESLKRGINPIVVDNTNTQAWEMQPYVVMAVQHGYAVEVLEPVTEWRNKEAELAKRNVHSIPREKIRQIMERFEPGWTGEKLIKSFGLKYKSGGESSHVAQEIKRSTNSLLAQHREHAAISTPEKPKRKKNNTKKKDRHFVTGLEINEDKEKQLEELKNLFAEYGKTMDPVSKQKVLESGVPISEVVSRMRQLQGNILPLPRSNPSAASSKAEPEPENSNELIKSVPNYSTVLRGSLSEPDAISSSYPSETSECETDTDAEMPRWKDVKRYFYGASNYFVEGEDMLEDDDDEDDDEAKSGAITPSKSSNLYATSGKDSPSLIDRKASIGESSFTREKLPLVDFEAVVDPSLSQDDLSLLNFDDMDNLTTRNSSSSSEEEDTQKQSSRNSLRDFYAESCQRIFDEPSEHIIDDLSDQRNYKTDDKPMGVELSDSLLNVFGRRFDNSDNPFACKEDVEPVQGGVSINESLLQMLVKKYSTDEAENLPSNINEKSCETENNIGTVMGCVKSPDIEEFPLPCIPPEGDDAVPLKPERDSAVSTKTEKEQGDFKQNTYEDIVRSWDHVDDIPSKDFKASDSPKEQRSKGAIRRTGVNIRDKSPDKLLRSVDLSWSSVPFTSPWEDLGKKPSVPDSQNMSKPQRSVLKSDSSTNTYHSDFQLWRKDDGVVKLVTRSRNINHDCADGQALTTNIKSDTLMLDKGSMTVCEDNELSLEKENAVETLTAMFPDIDREHLVDILDKCKNNILWTIEVLLETPRNLADIPASLDDNSAYNEAKPLDDPEHIPIMNVSISDGKKTIKRKKGKKSGSSELSQLLKKQIEESVQINENCYQDKTLLLKKLRHCEFTLDDPIPMMNQEMAKQDFENFQEAMESEEDEEEETIPMKLDPEFFKMFTQHFTSPEEPTDDKISDLFCPVIEVPMSLAQQIYDCWVENVNRQLEEMQVSCDRMVLDDEILANAFQKQEFESRQPDLREIMDMELAMLLYKQNQAHLHENYRETMATKLSKRLLFEAYPNMDKKMLLDLFESEGRSFQKTVDILSAQENQSPITVIAPEFLAAHGKQLFDQVKAEDVQKNLEKIKKPIITVKARPSRKEEASAEKNILLVNPVEHRQKAAQLHQQRNECCRLAQEAFRKKSYSVATYFSHIARLYKDRIRELYCEPFPSTLFDGKASKEMGKIDLHFLLVPEALQILDLFLDYHIKELRKRGPACVTVDVITGKGQHSVAKKSKIKPAVAKRLANRKMNYVLINPGMLRVTIHQKDTLSDEI